MTSQKHLNNLPSLFFALVLTLLALFTKSENDQSEKPAFAAKVQITSLAADVSPHITSPALIVDARVALIKELDGREIFVFNPEQHWPLASITKLMASAVALEKIGAGQKITISEKAIAADGDAGNFKIGEKIAAEDLIKAMMLVSSNDAAVALAEFFGWDAFVAEMNKKTRDLQMTRTNFYDPAGLDLANQSTIHDIEKMVKYIFRHHPELFTWSTQKQLDIAGRRLLNISKFAGRSDFAGGKTGFLEEASGNLVSIFKNKGKNVLIVVLGVEDRFSATERLYNFYKENYAR